MSKKRYIRVAIKANTERIFCEGFDPGVLVYHDMEVPAEQSAQRTAWDVISLGEALMKEYFTTDSKEITEEEYLETERQIAEREK